MSEMTSMFRKIFVITLLTGLLTCFGAYALEPAHYSSNSVLSNGNWVKIEVNKTGLHFISDSELSSMGLNPATVNVYGYGGGILPENLNSPDDLPCVPSMKTEAGLIFFAQGPVKWELNKNDGTTYSHLSDPYSDHAYYFLSDSGDSRNTPSIRPLSSNTMDGKNEITTFTERFVHEVDLTSPMKTGRLMLGEDFRNNNSQTFHFELPGNIGNVTATTAFACKTSSGISTLVFTANGGQLGATTADRLPASDSKLIITTKTVKSIENPGEILDFNIKYNPVGTVTTAGLDYIEIEYERTLDFNGDELYFYINPSEPSTVKISGCGENTSVWDVTDKTNPVAIGTNLKDGTLEFTTQEGYQEYVAFDSSQSFGKIGSLGRIENQDIHSMAVPDMLVICPEEYLSEAQRLSDLHRDTDGLNVAILTPEKIYNEFSSGKPDVTAFRKLLKMWYDKAEGADGAYPGYCLIMSRPTYDNKLITTVVRNAGYPRIPIWQSPDGESATTSYSTDDYIGMLEDVKGDFNINNAKINVAVGRMPVKSFKEAQLAIDKLEKYLSSGDYGSWRNNVMIIADDQDSGVHLQQAEECIGQMKGSPKGSDMLYEKLYLDSYNLEYTATGASYPDAKARMLSKIDEGVLFIDYIGHASSKEWGHEHILTWTDIEAMKNPRLPFIYAATCEFMEWDADEISGAEQMWLDPDGGVIGMICPSREVMISYNGELNKATSSHFFKQDDNGKPLRVGEIMIKGKNESNTGSNKLRYGLIGDPSLRLGMARQTIKLDSIDSISIESMEDAPVLKANSSVTISGHIENKEGKLIETFNGVLEFTVFDAEKAITTNGNGDDGEEMVYNDRKNSLFKGKAEVKDGTWTTGIIIPPDISNNFSTGLISMYAYSSEGEQANGSFDDFYVYGYNESGKEDFEGPRILECYLNYPGFKSGQEVGPNPVLYLSVNDESGICLSGNGIGHDMILDIDGKIFYDDLSQYYEPDLTDITGGSLSYPISDLEAGNHTLRFTVWDNAGNSSISELDFSLSAIWKPAIQVLATDVNPASNEVTFIVATNGVTDAQTCEIDVYDLNGRRVWSAPVEGSLSGETQMKLGWNLNDFSGRRIPRGIYPYTAVITTEAGERIRKSAKLAVTPP